MILHREMGASIGMKLPMLPGENLTTDDFPE